MCVCVCVCVVCVCVCVLCVCVFVLCCVCVCVLCYYPSCKNRLKNSFCLQKEPAKYSEEHLNIYQCIW